MFNSVSSSYRDILFITSIYVALLRMFISSARSSTNLEFSVALLSTNTN